ncbi:unnamed protein product [Colias eurytheme]|nr:unnamed protein product [Colias eurytheme]
MGAGFVIILGAVAFSAFWTTKFFKEMYWISKNNTTMTHTNFTASSTPAHYHRDFVEFLLTGVLMFSLYLVANEIRVHYKLLADDEYLRSDDFISNWYENNISTVDSDLI